MRVSLFQVMALPGGGTVPVTKNCDPSSDSNCIVAAEWGGLTWYYYYPPYENGTIGEAMLPVTGC